MTWRNYIPGNLQIRNDGLKIGHHIVRSVPIYVARETVNYNLGKLFIEGTPGLQVPGVERIVRQNVQYLSVNKSHGCIWIKRINMRIDLPTVPGAVAIDPSRTKFIGRKGNSAGTTVVGVIQDGKFDGEVTDDFDILVCRPLGGNFKLFSISYYFSNPINYCVQVLRNNPDCPSDWNCSHDDGKCIQRSFFAIESLFIHFGGCVITA